MENAELRVNNLHFPFFNFALVTQIQPLTVHLFREFRM